MIDVVLTVLYDVCLFNSAAQVVFCQVRSLQSFRLLVCFYIRMITIFLRNTVVLNAISEGICKTSAEIL